ncbi:hypothetical protein PT974_02408 [Cladobotryum mycophilum]|uniref:C2H2-type domain-containing protein n=1 Tax=Cladobotryum mycophilum TaxID=491253 RepID=A0ABR0SY63_9HYPO
MAEPTDQADCVPTEHKLWPLDHIEQQLEQQCYMLSLALDGLDDLKELESIRNSSVLDFLSLSKTTENLAFDQNCLILMNLIFSAKGPKTQLPPSASTSSLQAPRFKCETCPERFGSQEAANQHMTARRHRKPNISCQKCDKKFVDQEARNSHMTTCGKRKIPCRECNRKFADQEAVNQHKLSHGR